MWSLIKSNSTPFFKVFHALCTTYQLDNREMIRRAADLLTPAVPMRMEDGYQQIFASVNKVLIEEGHNSFHVHHVLWVCTLTFYQNLISHLIFESSFLISPVVFCVESVVSVKWFSATTVSTSPFATPFFPCCSPLSTRQSTSPVEWMKGKLIFIEFDKNGEISE